MGQDKQSCHQQPPEMLRVCHRPGNDTRPYAPTGSSVPRSGRSDSARRVAAKRALQPVAAKRATGCSDPKQSTPSRTWAAATQTTSDIRTRSVLRNVVPNIGPLAQLTTMVTQQARGFKSVMHHPHTSPPGGATSILTPGGANDLTACRMSLHTPCVASAPTVPAPLRLPHPYTHRRPTGFAPLYQPVGRWLRYLAITCAGLPSGGDPPAGSRSGLG